jgi:hypothetical protein
LLFITASLHHRITSSPHHFITASLHHRITSSPELFASALADHFFIHNS